MHIKNVAVMLATIARFDILALNFLNWEILNRFTILLIFQYVACSICARPFTEWPDTQKTGWGPLVGSLPTLHLDHVVENASKKWWKWFSMQELVFSCSWYFYRSKAEEIHEMDETQMNGPDYWWFNYWVLEIKRLDILLNSDRFT